MMTNISAKQQNLVVMNVTIYTKIKN